MSDTSLVRAQHVNGEIREVPQFWLDADKSPFPGNWTKVEEPAPPKRETVHVPSILDEAPTPEAAELKGAALDDALKSAGLPVSGSADEKRQRLADHNPIGA